MQAHSSQAAPFANFPVTGDNNVKPQCGVELVDEALGGGRKQAGQGWSESRLLALFCVFALVLISSAFITFAGLVLRILEPRSVLNEMQSTAILLHLLCYAILTTICLLVIYAICRKSATQLSWCCAGLFGHTLFAIGSGAFCLTLLFTPPLNAAEQLQSCLAANGPFLTHFCERNTVSKGTTLVLLIGSWILEMLAWYAVNRFVWQLNDAGADEKSEASSGDEWDRYFA